MRKLLAFVFLFAICSGNAFAKEIKIHGQVVDSLSGEPLPMSIISIVDENSNIFVFSGIVEKDDAVFSFEKIRIGNSAYFVVVSSVGYQKKRVTLDDDMGVIKMVPESIAIDEVVVTASRNIRRAVDRTTYILDSMKLAGVSVTTDVLRKIPEISVDELRRRASIKGKENTLILLNGVNTGNSVDLRGIDFRDIERIEVITSPSSGTDVDYDGVINIILKPKVRAGIMVDIEETLKLDTRSNDSYAGLTWGKDKVRIKLTYDNYYRANPYDITQLRYDKKSSYGRDGYCSKPFEITNGIGLNVDYYLSANDFLNLTTRSQFVRADKNIAYTATDFADFDARISSSYFIGNYTLFYRRTMKNKLTDYFSVNANFGFMNATEDSQTRYGDGMEFLNRETADKFSTNLRLAYNNRLSNIFRLNVGAQTLYQDFRGTLNNKTSDNNHRNYRNNLYADFYATTGLWQFRAGLKGEMNINSFTNPLYGSNRQFAFQPTLSALLKLNEVHSIKAEFRRPSYYPSSWLLAPYELRLDEKTILRGNPALKLTQYNIFELTYTYRTDALTLNAIPYYQQNYNLIIPKTNFDSDLNTIRTYVNGGQLSRTGLKINGTINLFGGAISIDPDINAGYDRMNVDGMVRNNIFWRAGGTAMIFLPYGLGCGAYGSYSSKMLTPNGYREPIYSIDAIFIMKRFEKLGLNLFFGYQMPIESADVEYTFAENYTQRDYFKFNSKGFILRANFYFTAGKSRRMERITTYFDNDRK
ncbi:putative TonB-dependent outer membrane receptor protein [Mucinivorans hirudinis]|uniref:Putative TonB-dependent outer membrane receptor protein n=1 Tax=Mucinivorans hirudinis TaxID=1433126 RepID=A0A060RAP6_9BACT|nr:putative TonB-dependent outer membrane receptor protein [Mucinivorans hirudinis]